MPSSKGQSGVSDQAEVESTLSAEEINDLVEQHVPLVKHIVFQVAVHFPRHVEREELARAGALGLVEAAQRYSPDRGIPFQRFAARRVRGAMLDAVRAADWAPRSVRRLSRRFDAMEQQLASQLGRAPSTTETAEALGMNPNELSKLRSQLYRSVVLALEHEVDGDNGEELNLLDVLPDQSNLEPEEQLEGRELYAYLQDAISLLPERHRLVIVGYFLEERTSVELARFLGVTESRVSQLRSDALEMLRNGISSQYEDRADDEETGRRAQRRKAYASAIGGASDWRDRLDEGAELSTRIRSVL
jgi:RNA polymerase sigma factor for flagellar operon FliA